MRILKKPELMLSGLFLLLLPLFSGTAEAHSIGYRVEQKGMALQAYYSQKKPAADIHYELYPPGDSAPYQSGRSDKSGYIAFVPDRTGIWKLKMWGEAGHGFHGVTAQITVNEAFKLESFDRPPQDEYGRYITGISLVFGLFGIYAMFAARKKMKQD